MTKVRKFCSGKHPTSVNKKLKKVQNVCSFFGTFKLKEFDKTDKDLKNWQKCRFADVILRKPKN